VSLDKYGQVLASSDPTYSWYWTTGKLFLQINYTDYSKCAITATASDTNTGYAYYPVAATIQRIQGYIMVEAYKVGTSTPQPVDTAMDVVVNC
jgi:hypothetical protein